jgi:DNA polymerase I-like protein with 3'-5' exonuclease and polymerase domains
VNYKIQGGTAVVTKEKIVELDAAGLGPFFRLAVHDELLYEVPEDLVPTAHEIVRRVMPDTRSFPGVTLEIEQDEVHRWGEHYRGDEYPAYVPTEPAPWLIESEAA